MSAAILRIKSRWEGYTNKLEDILIDEHIIRNNNMELTREVVCFMRSIDEILKSHKRRNILIYCCFGEGKGKKSRWKMNVLIIII